MNPEAKLKLYLAEQVKAVRKRLLETPKESGNEEVKFKNSRVNRLLKFHYEIVTVRGRPPICC